MDIKKLYEQLGSDLKSLCDLLGAIEFNPIYMKLIGSTQMKNVERDENNIYKLRSSLEKKYIMKGYDLLDLYKDRNKDSKISDIVNRLK